MTESWLPSIAYPPPDQHGYWEPITSTLQWCEEDYYATYYAAEIMNTLTNLMFFYCAWKGIQSCRKNGHDFVFQVAYYGYVLVGFGSFMFHATLKYPWQLVDELNMIYTTCLMAFASLSYRKSRAIQIALGIGSVLFCGGITAYYHYVQDPVFHQQVYALMTIWLVARSAWQMETALRPKWRHTLESDRIAKEKKGSKVPTRAEQEHLNKRDLDVLINMWAVVGWGVFVFLGGFVLWNLDNKFCSTLRVWRRELGLPWGVLLEGHAWWHILTGYGAYCYIVWGIHLRHVLNGDHDQYRMKWPRLWNLPEIVRNEPDKSYTNGHVKGQRNLNGGVKRSR